MWVAISRLNTYLSYLLRLTVTANILLLFARLPSMKQEASRGLYAWLIYSSVGVVFLAAFSIFTKADASRRTGKITDVLFAVVALALLVFLSISSVPAL